MKIYKTDNKIYNEFVNNTGLKLFLPFGKDIVLTETINDNMVDDILRNPEETLKQVLEETREEFFRTDFRRLKTLNSNINENNTIEVEYDYVFLKGVYGIGRLYSQNYYSLQYFTRYIRNALTENIYDDYDMQNAYPTLMLWLCKKYNLPTTYLADYVKNREQILKRVQSTKNISRDEAKKLFITFLMGDESQQSNILYIKKLKREVHENRKFLINKFPLLKQAIISKQEDRKNIYNLEGKVLSYILSSVENHVLMTIAQFYKDRKIINNNCVLMFDGIMMKKLQENEKKLLINQCMTFIKQQQNINIIIEIKPPKDIIDFNEVQGPLLHLGDQQENIKKLENFKGKDIIMVNDEKRKKKKVGSEYITRQLFENKFFKDFRLIETYEEPEEYQDDMKPAKDVLTELVNYEFFTNNLQQKQLLKLMFTKFKSFEKRKAYLIYYGGNPMRMISNNCKEYFDKNTNKILDEIFSQFVKKSDNDFSMMHLPPSIKEKKLQDYEKEYNIYKGNLFIDASKKLEEIRDIMHKDLKKYFTYPKLSRIKRVNIKKKYLKKINEIYKDQEETFLTLNLKRRPDQLLIYREFAEKNKQLIDFYQNHKGLILYNSYNDALEYILSSQFTKFSLLRTKVNFSSLIGNYELNIGGELIDIGIPHMGFSDEWATYDKKKFEEFIKKYTVVIHDKDLNFNYRTYNLDYTVLLLYKIIYVKQKYPWGDNKYVKRLARIFYFELFRVLDMFPVSLESLKQIKNEIINNKTMYLSKIKKHNQDFKKMIKKDKKQKKQYQEYLKSYQYYKNILIKVIDSMIKYFKNNYKMTDQNVYKINI